jgi:DNA-directed RNA polymerase subunit K/omega
MKVSERSEIRNAFEFVTVSGARARQLLAGCTPRSEGSEKPARLAQKEVKEGKIRKVQPEAAAE